MSIGFLQLDPNYIKRDYAGVEDRWFDEPKNSVVAFQFDPKDVKLVIPTKWKDGKPETATLLKIGMKYDREAIENQDRIELKLTFSDVVLNPGTISHDQLALTKRKPDELPEGVPNTQRSLEILEAMALPVIGRDAQTIKSVYFRDVEIRKAQNEGNGQLIGVESGVYRDVPQLRRGWVSLATARAAAPRRRFQKRRSVEILPERTTIEGKRLVLAPHPPRPLVLHLITPNPFKCVLQGLEIEILNLDNITGAPIVATAKVKLVAFNREIFEDGYDGLIQPEPINLGEQNENNEEALSLEDWNRKVSMSAGVIDTVPPKKEFVWVGYRRSTQQNTAAAEIHENARDKANLTRTEDPRRRPAMTDNP